MRMMRLLHFFHFDKCSSSVCSLLQPRRRRWLRGDLGISPYFSPHDHGIYSYIYHGRGNALLTHAHECLWCVRYNNESVSASNVCARGDPPWGFVINGAYTLHVYTNVIYIYILNMYVRYRRHITIRVFVRVYLSFQAFPTNIYRRKYKAHVSFKSKVYVVVYRVSKHIVLQYTYCNITVLVKVTLRGKIVYVLGSENNNVSSPRTYIVHCAYYTPASTPSQLLQTLYVHRIR